MDKVDAWDGSTLDAVFLTGEVKSPLDPPWDDLTSMDVRFTGSCTSIKIPAEACVAMVNDHREVRLSGYLWRYNPEKKVFQARIDPDRLTPWLEPASINVLTIE